MSDSGFSRKTSKLKDRNLFKISLRSRFKTAPKVEVELKDAYHVDLTSSSIKQRLGENSLNVRRAQKTILFTAKMCSDRLNWCKKEEKLVGRWWGWCNFLWWKQNNLNWSWFTSHGATYKQWTIQWWVQSIVKHSTWLGGTITNRGIEEIMLLQGTMN